MFGKACHWSVVALVACFDQAQAGCGGHSCFPSTSLSVGWEQESRALVQGRCWMRLLECYWDPHRQGMPWRWCLPSGQRWQPCEEREGGTALRHGSPNPCPCLTCTPGLQPGGIKNCLVLFLPSWLQALLERVWWRQVVVRGGQQCSGPAVAVREVRPVGQLWPL